MPTSPNQRVLLTGATGYVGRRLRRVLEEAGYPLRCMARQPNRLGSRAAKSTELVAADVFDPTSLDAALSDVDVAYYLVHSMGSKGNFERQDRLGAQNFAEAAKRQKVAKIIYLGGLGDDSDDLSPHLRSRQEVGRVLASTGIPVLEFRASVVIGSGSLSFELVRALVERLPVMLVPKWTQVKAQPIGIRSLLAYLEQGIAKETTHHKIYEIGGADVTSYEGLMRAYAEARGLKRRMLRVPVITPWLSSRWLGLVTPIYARVGKKLIGSIRHESIVTNHDARADFESVKPMGMKAALKLALEREEAEFVESRWFDALSSAGDKATPDEHGFGNRLGDKRSRDVPVPCHIAFRPIQQIGGRRGWYAFNWLWSARGAIDLLVGGVGTRRGRSHRTEIHVGDAIDFWRVEAFEPGRLLRLHAEMKLPGRAWLEFEVKPKGSGSTICQSAVMDPRGLWGLAYWYGIFPLHAFVFRGMIKGIARAAIAEDQESAE